MRSTWKRTIMVAALALTLAVSLPGCSIFGTSRGTGSFAGAGGHRLSEGKSMLLAGDTQGAARALRKVARGGRSAAAHYYLALVKRESDPAAALEHVQRSLSLYPTGQAHLLQGSLLEETDPAGAVRSYRLGLRRADENGPVARLLHRNLGFALMRREEWKEARSHLEVCADLAGAGGQRMQDAENAALGLCRYHTGEKQGAHGAWKLIRDTALREEVLEAAGATDVQLSVLQ